MVQGGLLRGVGSTPELGLFRGWLRISLASSHTADDINPALPIARNIYHNTHGLGPLR